jgi:hypothetical protein
MLLDPSFRIIECWVVIIQIGEALSLTFNKNKQMVPLLTRKHQPISITLLIEWQKEKKLLYSKVGFPRSLLRQGSNGYLLLVFSDYGFPHSILDLA